MKIQSYHIKDILVLGFQGNLNRDSFQKIKPYIIKIIMENYKKIILDMHQVKDVDVKWCSFLVKMYNSMNRYGRKLVITTSSNYLRNIGLREGVIPLYPCYSSLKEALSIFQPLDLDSKKSLLIGNRNEK